MSRFQISVFVLFFLTFFLPSSAYFQFYVQQNFSATQVGNGTLSNPYNNLFQAYMNISNNASFNTLIKTLSDRRAFIVLLSSYYIIKPDDFIGYTTYPVSVLASTQAYFIFTSQFCFNNYVNNIQDCPSNASTTVEIQYKTEYLKIVIAFGLQMINIRITGRDLYYTYNATADANCFFTQSGCCYDDSFFLIGSPNSKCIIQNSQSIRSDISLTVYGMIFATTNATLYLQNFELSYFSAFLKQSYSYTNLFLDQVAYNITHFFNNCTIFRVYLFCGVVYSYNAKNESVSYSNITVIDYNYYNFQEQPSRSAVAYVSAQKSIFWIFGDVNYPARAILTNITFLNSYYIIRVFNANLTITNVVLGNVSRNFSGLASTNDGFIVGLTNSGNALIAETSNFSIANIYIFNFTLNCMQVAPASASSYGVAGAFISAHRNTVISNMTFVNITTTMCNYPSAIIRLVQYSNAMIFNINIVNYISNSSMIFLDSAVTAVFADMHFANTFSNGIGGIFQGGTSFVTLENSTFENWTVLGYSNYLTLSSGALLSNYRGAGGLFYMNILSVIVIQNVSCVNGILPQGEGGIAYMELGGSLTINNCSFYNTSAYTYGSLALILDNATVVITNCLFNGVLGNAFMHRVYLNMTIANCSFTNFWTDVTREYGVIYSFQNSSILLQNNIFQSFAMDVKGGIVFFIHYTQINLTNIIFRNISIAQTCGILYGQGNDAVYILNVTHDRIYVASTLYSLDFQGSMSVINSSFNDISMTGVFNQMGGGFYLGTGFQITFDTVSFSNYFVDNYATGGVIYFDKSALIFNNIIIQNFSIGADGGVIYANTMNSLSLYNIYIVNLTAMSGGLLYLDSSNTLQINLITGSIVNAMLNGGLLSLNFNNNVTISQISMKNLSAQIYGGLIVGSKTNNITLSNAIVDNSFAGSFRSDVNSGNSGEGGLIYLNEMNHLSIENLVSKNSMSEREGGCLSFYGGANNISIKNSIFNISQAIDGNGGFLSFSGNIGANNLSLTQISVYSTFANNSGGFISISNNQNYVTIVGSIFLGSFAKFENGGGFYFENYNKIILYNNIIGIMSCNLQGGFLYLDINNTINISSCVVFNASSISGNGGFMNLEEGNKMVISFSNFSVSSTYSNGGGFYIYFKNTLLATNSNFQASSSMNNGGLLYSYQANNLTFLNNTFTNITAFMEGCLIYLYDSSLLNLTSNFLMLLIPNPTSSLVEAVFSSNVTLVDIHFLLNNVLSVLSLSENNNVSLRNSFFDGRSICISMFNIYYSGFNLTKVKFNLSITNYFAEVQYSSMQVKNCNFITGNAKKASLLNFLSSNLTLNKTKFTKSSSFGYVLIYAELSSVNMVNSVVFDVSSNYSGTFFSGRNSNFTSMHNFFIGHKSLISGGALDFSFDQNLSNIVILKASMFAGNKAFSYGGSVFFTDSTNLNNHQIRISKCNFYSNLAFRGGAVFVENAFNFSAIRNSFVRNTAQNFETLEAQRAKGGALYVSNSTNFKINNIFQQNKAEIGGVSYTAGILALNMSNNEYDSNNADFYGTDDATDVITISFLKNLDQTYKIRTFSINELRSGEIYSHCLTNITGLDYYDNVVYMTDENYSSWVTIKQSSNLELSNVYSYSLQDGFLCFNGLFKRNEMPIQSSFNYKISFKDQGDYYDSLSLDINFRDCQVGERLTDDRTCNPCPLNKYSFVTDFSLGTTEDCKVCDDSNNFYCFGGNNLTSKFNYWRLNEFSTNFIMCPGSSCLGDPRNPSLNDIMSGNVTYDAIYSSSLCSEGYTGILCNECADNYGHIDANTCLKCGSATYNFNLFFMLILRIIFTVYSVYQEYIMVCSICSSKIDKNEVVTTNILKIFVNHMQVLSVIRAFPFEWPSEFTFTANIFLSFSPNVSEGLSLECMVKGGYIDISTQYFKLVLCAVYPFILAFLSLVFIRLVQSFKKDKMTFLVAKQSTITEIKKKMSLSGFSSPVARASRVRDSVSFENIDKLIRINWVVISIFLCILILCFPDIIKVILSMFACTNVGDANNVDYRLITDYSLKCYSKNHELWTYFVAIPFLVILGIGFPAYVIGNMTWAYFKNQMGDREILLKYGFFFYAYKSNFYFWDLLILIRKMLLLFISIFFMTIVDVNKDLTPILLVFLIVVACALLQYQFAPFNEEKFNIVNNVETASLSTLVVTIMATLFYFGEIAVGRIIRGEVIAFLILVTVIANCLFIVFFLRAFYVHNIKVKIEKAKAKSQLLLSKLKTFKENFKKSTAWNSIKRRFSKSNPSSPEISSSGFTSKITKSFSKPFETIKTVIENQKKELFSPMHKPAVEDENYKGEDEILSLLKDILLQKGFEEVESYNLLMLEQERFKKKLFKIKKENKPTDFDLENEIPEEKPEAQQDSITRIYNNRIFYHLACLGEGNVLALNSFFTARSKCKLINNQPNDFFLKFKVEFNLQTEIDEFSYEMKEAEEFSIFVEEGKPKEGKLTRKKLNIFLKCLFIPITCPCLNVITRKQQKKILYQMKLPCTLNKFFVFENLSNEFSFWNDWNSLLHLYRRIKIKGSVTNTLGKLQIYFPKSNIFLKDLTIQKEFFLCGKFRLVFYPDFGYYYKIGFSEKNTHLNFEVSYPDITDFDPRQQFIGEVILDNYKRLFKYVQ